MHIVPTWNNRTGSADPAQAGPGGRLDAWAIRPAIIILNQTPGVRSLVASAFAATHVIILVPLSSPVTHDPAPR